MKRLPFRRRLTAWSTLVATVAILICGSIAVYSARRQEVAELDGRLQGLAGHFFEELQRHGGAAFDWRKMEHEMREWIPLTDSYWVAEVRAGDALRWRSAKAGAGSLAEYGPGGRDIPWEGGDLRLLVREEQGVTLALGQRLNGVDALVRRLIYRLLAGLPLAIAFAWFGGRRVASLAVETIRELTAAVERISAERLDQRVPVPPVRDEMQRHAQVLNATLDRLERSYQQALRFSADASHELKTPLTVMRASIEAILDSPGLGESERHAVASLLEQTRKLTDITSSLLLLARADAGLLALETSAHDLASLTEACVEDARIMAEPRGVAVEYRAPERALAQVDPLRFAQIVSNLLDNAVKYNNPGGQVRVSLEEAGDKWRISVANTWPGIAPEHLVNLFERFFRAGQSSERQGHGLGLSLARELALAHGGDLVLQRSDREWTEFVLTLPKDGLRTRR